MTFTSSAGRIIVTVAHTLVKNSYVISAAAYSSVSRNDLVVTCRLAVGSVGVGTHKELVGTGSIQIIGSNSTVISAVIFICLIIIVVEVNCAALQRSLIGYSKG